MSILLDPNVWSPTFKGKTRCEEKSLTPPLPGIEIQRSILTFKTYNNMQILLDALRLVECYVRQIWTIVRSQYSTFACCTFPTKRLNGELG